MSQMLEPETEAELRDLLKSLRGGSKKAEPDTPSLPSLMDTAKLAAQLLTAVAGAAGVCYAFGFIIFNTYVSQFGLHSFELASPTFFLAGLSFIGLMLLPLTAFGLLPSIITLQFENLRMETSGKAVAVLVFFLIFVEIGLVALFSLAFALGDFTTLPSLALALILLFLTVSCGWGALNAKMSRRAVYLGLLPVVQIVAGVLLVSIGAPENATAYYAAGGILFVAAVASAAQGVFIEFFTFWRGLRDAWVIIVIGIVALTVFTLMLSFIVPIWARLVYPQIDHSFGGGDLKGATVRVAFLEKSGSGGPTLRNALASVLGASFDPDAKFSPPLDLLEDGGTALIVIIETEDEGRQILRLPRTALAGVMYGAQER